MWVCVCDVIFDLIDDMSMIQNRDVPSASSGMEKKTFADEAQLSYGPGRPRY